MKRNLFFILGILIIVGVFASWSYERSQQAANSPACPDDAQLCPDGTPVVRQGKNCEFAPCPANPQVNITVSEPMANQEIDLPLVIKGTARVYENSLNYRLSDATGKVLVEGYTTADAPDVGLYGPFSVSVNYPQPQSTSGKLEVFSHSAKDGEEINKISIPIIFGLDQSQEVSVFFANRIKDPAFKDCTKVFALKRRVAWTTGVARAALEELLQGPTIGDGDLGYISNINPGVTINKLEVTADGTANVDFSDLLTAGVAGSCRVQAIRSQIEHTLMQYPNVKRVKISVNGESETILQP